MFVTYLLLLCRVFFFAKTCETSPLSNLSPTSSTRIDSGTTIQREPYKTGYEQAKRGGMHQSHSQSLHLFKLPKLRQPFRARCGQRCKRKTTFSYPMGRLRTLRSFTRRRTPGKVSLISKCLLRPALHSRGTGRFAKGYLGVCEHALLRKALSSRSLALLDSLFPSTPLTPSPTTLPFSQRSFSCSSVCHPCRAGILEEIARTNHPSFHLFDLYRAERT